MNVVLDEHVLAHPQRYGRDLAAIIDRCEQGQHRWYIEDLNAVLASAWVIKKAEYDVIDQVAVKSYREAIDRPTSGKPSLTVRVTIEPAQLEPKAGSFEATPARARQILEAPAYVVVENETSDRSFLLALARSCSRDCLVAAFKCRWLVARGGGGSGEVEKVVRSLLRDEVAPWRIAVVLDSDRFDNGPLPKAVAALLKKLQELSVRAHVLHKREIENYLPVTLLQPRTSKRRRKIWRSFPELTRTQRDYYDMKQGFSEGPQGQAIVKEEQATLFSEVTAWHLRNLIGGFGDDIASAFDDASISASELASVCETAPGELEALLDMLEAIL